MFDSHCHPGKPTSNALVCTASTLDKHLLSYFPYPSLGALPGYNSSIQDMEEWLKISPFIGEIGPVRKSEHQAARVIGDDPVAHEVLPFVGLMANGLGRLDDREEKVRLEVRLGALQDAGKPFEAAAGVDVLGGQFLVVAAIDSRDGIVLGENNVPNLDVPIVLQPRPSGSKRSPRSKKISVSGPQGPSPISQKFPSRGMRWLASIPTFCQSSNVAWSCGS